MHATRQPAPPRLLLSALVLLVSGAARADLVTASREGPGTRVALNTGALDLDLVTDARTLRLARLARPNGRNEVGRPGAGGLWQLKVRTATGEQVLSEDQTTALSVTALADRAVFTWRLSLGQATGQVTATVRVAANDPLSYWTIAVELPASHRLSEVEFPRLTNLLRRPDHKLAVPWCDGVEYDLKPGMAYGDTYPSMLASLQLLALYGDGQGVYLAAHDPRAGSKTVRARALDERVELVLSPWPDSAATGAAGWRTDYETALGVFAGDWRTAAERYRTFAAQTPWWQAAESPSGASWFGEVDVQLTNDASWFPLDSEAVTRAGQVFAGVNKLIHWYNWYQVGQGGMSRYPDFVARDGFTTAVQEAKRAGFKVMPYLDGRVWCRDNPSYAAEKADELAARKADGSLYGAYTNCVVMCPWLPRWHDKVAAEAQRAVREYGADAVYIDEVGAAAAVPCFAPGHGHPLGGGTWWIEGYRAMSAKLRRTLPPTVAQTTEHAAECYLGDWDGFCTVNNPFVPPSIGRTIPLFAAVYAGRATPFGFRADDCTEAGFAHPLSFRQNQAEAFLRGSQLGWIHSRIIMHPRAKAELAYLRNLVRVRAQAHDYLVRGRLLQPVTVAGDNAALMATVPLPDWLLWVPSWAPFAYRATKCYQIDMPAVQATAWRASNGAVGVAVVNPSAQERAIGLRLPLAAAGWPSGVRPAVRAVGPDGPVPVTLEGRDVAVTRIAADSALLVEAPRP